ncbi:MAG: DEAD/DEAH box helicase [Cytophagales bacterium]
MNTTAPTQPEILANLNIATLNKMQEASIAANAKCADVVLLSPTGSGKTLGFLLPMYQTLDTQSIDIQAIIIVPSRELALQIEQVFKNMKTGYKVNTCYGGHDLAIEENNLTVPPAVLIGTPGRICDHINRRNIFLQPVKTLVLDEFDKCLEMGFQDDMAFIIKHLTGLKKRILTSATQAIKIPEFAGLSNPEKLNFLVIKNESLTIKYVRASDNDKLETLLKLICYLGNESTIVFCNQRDAVEEVCDFLTKRGIINHNFHGGLEQRYRESTLTKFRNGSSNLLITTDLAARGLDIPAVKFVVHYQMPPKEDAFVHRNGRTARMEALGTAILLLNTQDHLPEYIKGKPENIELPAKIQLPALPEWETLFLGGGKKDKINKVDIVGFLSQKGGLQKDELGLIEIKDMNAYAAVKRSKIKEVIQLVVNEKIKGKKVKIEIARDTPKFEG